MGEAALFTYGQGNVLPAEFLEQEISTLPHLERSKRMPKPISKSDSEKGRAIWEGVSKAAERCPEWVRPQVVPPFNETGCRAGSSDPD